MYVFVVVNLFIFFSNWVFILEKDYLWKVSIWKVCFESLVKNMILYKFDKIRCKETVGWEWILGVFVILMIGSFKKD